MDLLEIVAEILFEVYGEIVCALFPEKTFGKKISTLLRVLTLLFSLGGVITLIVGICLLAEKHAAGVPVTAVGASLLFVYIIAFAAFAIIKHKKKKAEKIEAALKRDDKTTI